MNLSNLRFYLISLLFILIIKIKINSSQSESTISTANNYFAFNLLKKLFNENKNVLISPLSISTAFSMLYFGAKERTAKELADVLGFRLLNLTTEEIGKQYKTFIEDLIIRNSSDYELNSANRVVIQSRNPILKDYESNLKNYFNSSVQIVDFLFNTNEAIDQINDWVSNATRGKIQKLLDQPLSPLSVLVLLNAVYFKGKWREQFLKWATKEEEFYRNDKAIKVPMMKLNTDFHYTTVPELNSQLIELPYVGNEIAMYILLPNENDGIKSYKTSLNHSIFDKAIANLTKTTVRLILPKFKIEDSYSLKDYLISLGIKQAFTYKSDLSGIDGTKYLHVSEIYHKAICEVNEEGSEAAAATGVVVSTRGLFGRYRNVPTFKADHSFAFFIRHKVNGIILFAGIVNKP